MVNAVESINSAQVDARPCGVESCVPSPFAEELYNINMAGTTSDSRNVTNGAVIIAPSLISGSDIWNNLTCENWWSFTGPRTITNANGSGTITIDWTGETGHHSARPWNSDGYEDLFRAMFGTPDLADPDWDLSMSIRGLDKNASYDIYWYSTWGENENPVTVSVTSGTCESPVKTLYPEQDNVVAGNNYAYLAEGVNYVILADITPASSGGRGSSGFITIRSQGQLVSVAGFQVVKRPNAEN